MTDTNDAIPMTEPALLEPSFADAATAIEGAVDLPARTRSHWLCSLRQIAKALDKPMAIIPARWTAIRLRSDACTTPGWGEREDACQPQIERARGAAVVRQ